jgi:hypothetical protein
LLELERGTEMTHELETSVSWFHRFAASVVIAMACCESSLGSSASSHGHNEHAEHEKVDEGEVSPDRIRGIEVGEFRIRAYYPVQAQKSMVRFVLHLTAKGERYASLQTLVKTRRHKIRDQVITGTRLVPLADFDEADLKSFRRRIVLRLRRTMPELPLDDAYVSNFELKVQSL